MSKTFTTQFNLNANMTGNLTAQIKAAQSAMNAFKSASNFKASPFSGKRSGQLAEFQKLQSQIQAYKDALRELSKQQAAYQQQVAKNSQAAADKKAAADKVSALKIQLEALKTAKASLKSTSDEYKNLSAQIKSTKADLKSANAELKAANQVFNASQNKTLNMGRGVSQQIAELQRLRGALSSAGVGLNQLGAAETRLQSSIQSANAALQQQQNLANRRMNFNAAQDKLSNSYSNFQNATQTAQTVMSPFTNAAQNAMDYEYELANVKALTQLKDIRAGNFEKVNAEMASMDKIFRRLGATSEFTSQQVAQSAGFFAMAGFDSEKIKSILPAFINLATATRTSGVELARLADVFSDDMTAAGLKAGEMMTLASGKQMESAEYFSNAFAYAVTNANLNRESLHESVKYFAPIAKQLGLDVSEMFATSMLTANAGIKGSQMGTAFRAGLIRMVAPTKGAAGALEEMGMSMSDAQKGFNEAGAALESVGIDNALPFTEKIQKMAQYLSTVDQNQKMDFLNKVFGKNAISAWAEILENPEKVAQIAQYSKAMKSDEMLGYSADTANLMRDSTKIQVEQLKSAWDAVVNQFGTALLPSITNLAQSIAPILLQLSEWIALNPQVVQGLAMIAAGISAVVVGAAGIQLVSAAFGMVTASASLAGGAISTALAFLRGLSFASIASTISSMGSAFMAAARGAMAFCLTPVGAALAILAVLAYGVYQNWDKVGPVFQKLGGIISSVVGGAIEKISSLIGKVKEFLGLGEEKPPELKLPEISASAEMKLPTAAKVASHRLDATPQQIEAQVQAIKIQQSVPTAEKVASHRIDAAPVEVSQSAQTAAALTNNLLNANFAATNFSSALQNAVTSSQNLSSDFTAHSASIQSNAAELTNANAAIQNASFSSQELSTAQAMTSASSQMLTSDFMANSASVQSNAAELTNANAAIQNASFSSQELSTAQAMTSASSQMLSSDFMANSASVQNNAMAMDTSVGSVMNMAASADGSTGSISAMAGSADGASGSISGLGSAASSAISALMSAAASAGSAVMGVVSSIGSFFSGGVAQNASGGIYNHGAFLTWFAEKSPEAAIPLDGSSRAISLWQQAGQILGIRGYGLGTGEGLGARDWGLGTRESSLTLNPRSLIPMTGTKESSLTLNPYSLALSFKTAFNQIKGGNFKAAFSSIKDTLKSGSFQNAKSTITDIFNGGNVFGNILKTKTENGSYWGQQSPVLGGDNFPLLKNLAQDSGGAFPTLQNATSTAETANDFGGGNVTFNFTINVTANNAEEFQQAMPQIQESFESQMRRYLGEQRRRAFI